MPGADQLVQLLLDLLRRLLPRLQRAGDHVDDGWGVVRFGAVAGAGARPVARPPTPPPPRPGGGRSPPPTGPAPPAGPDSSRSHPASGGARARSPPGTGGRSPPFAASAARPHSRRLVSCSSCARLLRAVATSGWSGPYDRSSIANARRIQRLGLTQAVGGLQQLRQVVEVGGDVGVVRAVRPLVDRQRPPHQRLGLTQAVGVLQQLRQVVEVGGDVGVVRAVRPLVDRQRPPIQRLGLTQAVGVLQQLPPGC